MLGRIVITLSQRDLAVEVGAALATACSGSVFLANPSTALDLLQGAEAVGLLVTGTDFGTKTPRASELIRACRYHNPAARVLCVGEAKPLDSDAFVAMPCDATEINRKAIELLNARSSFSIPQCAQHAPAQSAEPAPACARGAECVR